MRAFLAPMQQLGEFEEISRKLAGNRGMLQVTGCIDSQKSHFIYCAGQEFQEVVRRAHARADGTAGPGWRSGTQLPDVPCASLIITYNDLRAKEIYENYRFFDRDVLYFPAKDLIFFQADIHSNLLEQQRISGHHDDGRLHEPSDAV